MKPLYLKGISGMRVDYDEPALTVGAPGKSVQLFPLSRVSRVVATGSMAWSMSALLACADAGVTVVFLQDTGEVRAQWLGRCRYRCNLLQSFAEVMQRPDAVDRYRDWLAGMRRMAVRSAARRLHFSDWQEADAAALQAWFERSQGRSWDGVNGWLQGFLLSTVAHELGRLGLDAGSECWRDQRVNVLDDFVRLLFWDFYPALSRWRQQSKAVPAHHELVAFYQRRCARTEHLLRSLSNRWHRWLLSRF